jgi:hypothetical protein
MGMTERLREDAIVRILGDLAQADLGDPRRVLRAQKIAGRLATNPGASLPDALETEAELEGAYRFFNSEHVTFNDLLDPHALGAVERASGAGVVLAIHDTTTCKFAHADPAEVGYTNTGKAGFLLHLTLLVDTREWKRPLGVVHGEVLTRRKKRAGKRKGAKSGRSALKPKESDRWLRGVEQTEQRLDGTASVIHIADRESDSYPLMAAMMAVERRFIFRACHDRIVEDAGTKSRVRTLVERADVVLERSVPISRRLTESAPVARRRHPPRDARVARLHFATAAAVLCAPQHCRGVPKTLAVNVVHVYEQDAPEGQAPVDWLLYTTEPVETAEQIAWIVDAYRARWLIEELNKALKTGCVVQERQLESYPALLNMLALSLPIAVELLALRSLARSDPSRPASSLFTHGMLSALRRLSHRQLPARATVQDALWCVAGIGGHIENNGPPGWQVLQRGMEKFLSFAAGWCAREEADL